MNNNNNKNKNKNKNSLWWAISGRFLNGLLNGNFGVAKSYLSEM